MAWCRQWPLCERQMISGLVLRRRIQPPKKSAWAVSAGRHNEEVGDERTAWYPVGTPPFGGGVVAAVIPFSDTVVTLRLFAGTPHFPGATGAFSTIRQLANSRPTTLYSL